ncbi:MAG: bile acid:sodium symporter family protein [Calditrichaeota bacterium]|nr:bile acid:sodium symporter family protein [Calditrichota bacterium]
MLDIDAIQLNFDPGNLLMLNIILGIVMFGVAIDMRLSDFRTIISLPRSMLVGMTGQFLLLPAVTYLLVRLMAPHPSIALGMMLVAACPGGNISNFITHFAKGNTALSVAMSATSTLAAVVMTPLNFAFWASQYEPTAAILKEVALSPLDLMGTVFLLLGLPMTVGLLISHRFPEWAERAKKPLRYFSMAFFGIFITGALLANLDNFMNYIGLVVLAVFLHNALAISIGYTGARLLKLPEADRRAVAIETGIQNSGLGLLLIFDFFSGLGGMALIAAWWGIWHIISGMTLAIFWSRRKSTI